MFNRSLMLLGVSYALAASVYAAPAWAEFDPPVAVSKAGQSASLPHVAIDSVGRALIVWQRSDGRIQARLRSAVGRLRPLEIVFRSAGSTPQAAMDADGNALIVWVNGGRIKARTRAADAVYGPVQNLSQAAFSAEAPRIAMDAAGNALMAWQFSDGDGNLRIQARSRSAAGVFGPIRTLSDRGQGAVNHQIAMGATGDAVVVWERNGRIQARAWSAAGVLGPVETLSGSGAHDPRAATDAAGNVLVVWQRAGRIQGRIRTAAGVLGSIETFSTEGDFASVPNIAMNADGDALIAWVGADATSFVVKGRARSAAGVLDPEDTIFSQSGQSPDAPQLAIDAAGDSVLVWRSFDAATATTALQARARSSDGTLAPLQTLSDDTRYVQLPHFAMNPNGAAVAVWEQEEDGGYYRIHAAADDGSAPAAAAH
jgi:hypothetical protein